MNFLLCLQRSGLLMDSAAYIGQLTAFFNISYFDNIVGAVKCCILCKVMKHYQCHTCSSHSYNPNLTSGPLGPRQIGNLRRILYSHYTCEPKLFATNV